MGQARDAVERFFERFGAGDIDGALECFAPDCISITPTGPLNNAQHHAAADATGLPHELIRVLESGDEVYVTGRRPDQYGRSTGTDAGHYVVRRVVGDRALGCA
jgi:ketosteroid isomerase-like protein